MNHQLYVDYPFAMEWPSNNVQQNGIFHTRKAAYSENTHQFLKLLMEESKLSMMQRKKINYFLRNGEPLPNPNRSKHHESSKMPPVLIRPGSSKRRSKDTIVNSGAYLRDKFKPIHPVIDREKEKEKLQNKMAFNAELKVSKQKVIDKLSDNETKETPNRFDQLVQEIKEREEWLKEMETLGEADKYKLIIEQQIQNKVREMEKLKIADE